MKMQMPRDPFAHAILAVDETDLSIDESTLDEIEIAAELASLGSTQAPVHDRNE